jgi:hypothetical protein
MSRVYRFIFEVSWGLGLLSLVVAVILKILPTLADRIRVSPRAGLILAGVLFLCTLATHAMQGATAPRS